VNSSTCAGDLEQNSATSPVPTGLLLLLLHLAAMSYHPDTGVPASATSAAQNCHDSPCTIGVLSRSYGQKAPTPATALPGRRKKALTAPIPAAVITSFNLLTEHRTVRILPPKPRATDLLLLC
jgi:hypothetical protein